MPDDKPKQLQKVRRRPPQIVPPQYDVDAQISTAKKFPRDLVKARIAAECAVVAAEQAQLKEDEQKAACYYALPRQKKDEHGRWRTEFIMGPNVRLAEILAQTYGNLRVAARQIGEDDKAVYAEAVTWDLENNLIILMEARRSITYSGGGKYKPDMVTVTANANTAVALRNSVLRVVPQAFWQPLYKLAQRTTAEGRNGKGKKLPLEERRARMFRYFVALGADKDAVLAVLGREKPEDVTEEDLVKCRGMATAIDNKEASAKSIFGTGPAEFDGQPEEDAALESLFTEGEQAPASELQAGAGAPG